MPYVYIVNLGIETPFTKGELRELGVMLPEIHISSYEDTALARL
jgi:hypothetical protein